MSQPPVPPGLLSPQAEQLIGGQYADRPHLRPILDAVLAAARWEVQVTVRRGDDGLDFGGPFVRGDRTDRHLGIVWGDVTAGGTFRLIRGSKLKLAEVDPALVAEAMRPGSRLVARVRIRPPDLAWSWSVAHA